MFLGNIVYQLFDEHGLAHAGTSEKADFTTFQIRLQQVYDLDSSVEHLLRGRKVLEFRRLPMDWQSIVFVQIAQAVYRLADDIHHAAPYLRPDRHGNRSFRVDDFHSTLKAVGRIHRDASHSVLPNVLLHLYYQISLAVSVDRQRIIDAWEHRLFLIRLQIEMNIDHRADDLRDITNVFRHYLIS